MAKKDIKIQRKRDSKYKVTDIDGSKETFIARRFEVINGDVFFYDKMDKKVKSYTSEATIEVD